MVLLSSVPNLHPKDPVLSPAVASVPPHHGLSQHLLLLQLVQLQSFPDSVLHLHWLLSSQPIPTMRILEFQTLLARALAACPFFFDLPKSRIVHTFLPLIVQSSLNLSW